MFLPHFCGQDLSGCGCPACYRYYNHFGGTVMINKTCLLLALLSLLALPGCNRNMDASKTSTLPLVTATALKSTKFEVIAGDRDLRPFPSGAPEDNKGVENEHADLVHYVYEETLAGRDVVREPQFLNNAPLVAVNKLEPGKTYFFWATVALWRTGQQPPAFRSAYFHAAEVYAPQVENYLVQKTIILTSFSDHFAVGYKNLYAPQNAAYGRREFKDTIPEEGVEIRVAIVKLTDNGLLQIFAPPPNNSQ
jgi:hypothetical protein